MRALSWHNLELGFDCSMVQRPQLQKLSLQPALAAIARKRLGQSVLALDHQE
jgi:hypothetical protein